MPTPTYTPLATVTLGASASSVTFSSIPATYRDLILITSGQSLTNAVDALVVRLNSDTGSNYSFVFMEGTGSGSGNSSSGTTTYIPAGITGTAQTDNLIQIMDYSATDKHTTTISRGNHAGNRTRAIAGRWANTSAVNTIRLFTEAGTNFTSGSTFSLYGVIA
jgi:hypothetical protein